MIPSPLRLACSSIARQSRVEMTIGIDLGDKAGTHRKLPFGTGEIEESNPAR